MLCGYCLELFGFRPWHPSWLVPLVSAQTPLLSPPFTASLNDAPFCLVAVYSSLFAPLWVAPQHCPVWLWNGLPPVCCSLECRLHGSRTSSFWLESIPVCPWRVQLCNGAFMNDVYPKATPHCCQSIPVVQWPRTTELKGTWEAEVTCKNMTSHVIQHCKLFPRQKSRGTEDTLYN